MITLQRQLSKNFRQLRSFTSSSILSSKNEDETDKPIENDEEKNKKEELTSKLNSLLQTMVQKDNDRPLKQAQVAQAFKHKKEKQQREKPFAQKLEGAAKDVASSLEGDVKETESELLNILLRRSAPSSHGLDEILKGIKVEKSVDPDNRAQQVREILANRKKHPSEDGSFSASIMREKRKPQKRSAAHVDILGAQPSAYFKDLQPHPPPCELRTWQSCVERDLRLAVTHPPANIYEQLAQWTDRGVIWKFPIDNEQGLDEEKKVSFEEHIFMEEHLEGWCPDKGPIRHFMELVCVGLSKNYWLTVEEKKQHIFWYRDYFADKKSLIAEIGAGIISVEETGEQKELSK